MKRLKQRVAIVLGALALTSAAGASASAPQPVARPTAAHGPALWKVADEDTTIYLFGTVHALPRETQWLDERIERALASSAELVTEVNLADAADAKAGILQLALLPQGVTLRALLKEPERALYEKAMTDQGLPIAAFDRFEPWYAAMMLSLLPLAKEGITAESGVEAVLEAKLPPERKRGALESVNFQLQLFDGLPPETQITYLREVAEGAPEMKAQLGRMIDQWLKGDAEKLAELINEETSDPVLMERLLFDRNRTWAKWIAERMKQPGTVFMAVGAGHLAGNGSVQDALAQDGIASVRVH